MQFPQYGTVLAVSLSVFPLASKASSWSTDTTIDSKRMLQDAFQCGGQCKGDYQCRNESGGCWKCGGYDAFFNGKCLNPGTSTQDNRFCTSSCLEDDDCIVSGACRKCDLVRKLCVIPDEDIACGSFCLEDFDCARGSNSCKECDETQRVCVGREGALNCSKKCVEDNDCIGGTCWKCDPYRQICGDDSFADRDGQWLSRASIRRIDWKLIACASGLLAARWTSP